MKRTLLSRIALCLCAVAVFTAPSQAEPTKPNVLFFLVDDLGWADVGHNGSTFYETPHIDALAESGMRFTHGYAAASICSPTRASIMTGRHPVRVDITDWIPGKRVKDQKFLQVEDRDNLGLDEVTIAEALKEHGYQTFFAGKWHLGGEGHLPTDQGFDVNVGGGTAGSPPGGYYPPWRYDSLKPNHDDEHLSENLTQASLRFLESRDPSEPFLLYLSYYSVHTPIQPYKNRVAHFREKAKEANASGLTAADPIEEHDGLSRAAQDNPEYASMVAAVDRSVGVLLERLGQLGLSENTVVVFFSDNGGLCTKAKPGPTSNLPLRSGKGWLYEGGIREPAIIRAPGVTEAGSVSSTPILSTDFFPTLLELAGLPSRPELHADGQSLVPILRGEETPPRTLYWHYPHYHGSTWKPGAAIRDGDWKLIEFYHDDKVELYNLAEDPGEHDDLAAVHPEKTNELLDELHAWQNDIDAKMPRPNPDHPAGDPAN